MKPYQYLILAAAVLVMTIWVFRDIDRSYQIQRNTDLHFNKKQAPLVINVTGPHTTIIKTKDEVLLIEDK